MLETAITAAKLAGETLEYYFETVFEHEEKDDKSVVTKADLEADKVIIKTIQAKFPNHSILTEENGLIGKESRFKWIIDPLDGTLTFSRGIPIFAVSIALQEDAETKLAVVYNPAIKSLFQAEKGRGAFWNEERVAVSTRDWQSDVVVTLGRGWGQKEKEKTFEIYKKLFYKAKSERIFGSAALELAWVASGRTEAFVSVGLKNWDVLAGLLLVSEAGGKITDFAGKEITDESQYIVASNGKIHEELLEVINA